MDSKLIGLIVLSIFLLMTLPVALAEETILDANTTGEIKIMSTQSGAEIRLLQLERSLVRNGLVGARVMEMIQTNHPEFDITETQNKLNELEVLLEDVKNYNLEENSETVVENFVAMKKEALLISQEFKNMTSTKLSTQNREAVRLMVNATEVNELAPINEAVKTTIRLHNAEKIGNLFSLMGINNSELLQRIRIGEATKTQAMTSLKESFSGLNTKIKTQVEIKIKEATSKRLVTEKSFAQRAQNLSQEKLNERLNQRSQKVDDLNKRIGANADPFSYQVMSERMLQVSNTISNRAQQIVNNINGQGAGGN